MLQDCPSLIQPQASFTRENSISESTSPSPLQDGDTNQIDAEASSILIGFANQDTDKTNNEYSVLFHRLEPLLHTSTTLLFNNNKMSTKGNKVTLPIKTYNNLHLQKKREQPDPIQLLAAAAAVIDEGRYKGRFYERREIRLQTRPNSSSLSKKSPNIRHQTKSSGSLISDRRTTPEIEIGNESQSEGTHAFSWQYMSMRQNPRIKRNAMHAYITYMIYTDLTHESTKKKKSDNKQKKYKMTSQPITTAVPPSEEKEKETDYRMQTKSWQNMQSYILPPQQQQQQQDVVASNGLGRPLTDFLFEQRDRTPNSTNGILLPPPPTRATLYSD